MATKSDTINLLIREVERLVTAPYAPSLQDIYRLTQEASSNVVNAWVSRKPCQVVALVDVLVDGLTRSRFALPLLASFARAPGFRDHLLQRHPHLLDQFLQQSTERHETECFSLCVSLLSSPLPCGLIPPASLASFVSKLIEFMRENPCVETVRPLYLISSCLQASGILFELPQEVMSCFQAELTKTLRNLEDHMGNLLCLATFARLASSEAAHAEAENGLEVPPWLQSIRHFFGPKRGLKTLDLVVLRVILACSSRCGNLTAEESAQSIRLAISILDSVDRDLRQCWIEKNSIKIAKLHEKVTRDDIDHNVQILGISFLVSLIPAASLSPDLVRLPLEWLMSEDPSIVLEIIPPHVISRLAGTNAACSGQLALNKVLDYLFSALSTNASGSVDMAKLQIAKLLLWELQPSVSTVFPSAFGDSMSKQYGKLIPGLMESFPRQPYKLRCDGSTTCYASASRLENDLLSDLLAFWLEATLPQNMGQDASRSSEMATLIRFMERSKRLLPETICMLSETKPLDLRTSFSFLDIREMASPPRDDWRTNVREALTANSRMTNENIIQKVESICYELEQRCDKIEAPLRAAEEECGKHRLESERLKEQNHDLETRLQQALNTTAELRGEMSRLESQASSATDRIEELSVSLAQALHHVEELQHTSQETLISERKSSRTKELDMIASLTEKDDRLEELQEKITRQTEENERLRIMLGSVSKEKDSSLEGIASLKTEVSIFQTKLEEHRTFLAEKDERIEQLITEKKDADNLTERLQIKLDGEVSESERLRTALRDHTEQFKAELEALQKRTDLHHSELTKESKEQKANIEFLQRAMHEAATNATRELQAREKQIQRLERKVQHLREERAAKAREFSEAQQHISRLMGVMGFKPAASDTRASDKQRSRRSFELSQVATMQTQTDSGEGISQHRKEDLFATSVESTTSPPGGRSPKRSRNNAFPSAQPSSPHSQGSSKKSKESAFNVHRERKPLGEADRNSLPNSLCSGLSPSSRRESFHNTTDQNHLDDIDLDLDLEFSNDFVFTSTSVSKLNDHART